MEKSGAEGIKGKHRAEHGRCMSCAFCTLYCILYPVLYIRYTLLWSNDLFLFFIAEHLLDGMKRHWKNIEILLCMRWELVVIGKILKLM